MCSVHYYQGVPLHEQKMSQRLKDIHGKYVGAEMKALTSPKKHERIGQDEREREHSPPEFINYLWSATRTGATVYLKVVAAVVYVYACVVAAVAKAVEAVASIVAVRVRAFIVSRQYPQPDQQQPKFDGVDINKGMTLFLNNCLSKE